MIYFIGKNILKYPQLLAIVEIGKTILNTVTALTAHLRRAKIAGKSKINKVGSVAGRTLSNPNASAVQRSLAGSALAQKGTNKAAGKAMEAKASATLQNRTASTTTKQLANSITSQAIKKC